MQGTLTKPRPCAPLLSPQPEIHSWSDFPVQTTHKLKGRLHVDILAPHPSLNYIVEPGPKKVAAVFKDGETFPLFLVATYPLRSVLYWLRDPFHFIQNSKYLAVGEVVRNLLSSHAHLETQMRGSGFRFLGEPIALLKLDGVFPPKSVYSEQLIQQTLPRLQPAERVLVLGCGSGIDTVMLALHSQAFITASDIDPRAVLATRLNLDLVGANGIKAEMSDLFSNISGTYDHILFNAPRTISRALERAKDPAFTENDFLALKGDIGFEPMRFDLDGELLAQFLDEAPSYLNPQGEVILMADSLLKTVLPRQWKARKLSPDIPWGRDVSDTFAIFALSLKQPFNRL